MNLLYKGVVSQVKYGTHLSTEFSLYTTNSNRHLSNSVNPFNTILPRTASTTPLLSVLALILIPVGNAVLGLMLWIPTSLVQFFHTRLQDLKNLTNEIICPPMPSF